MEVKEDSQHFFNFSTNRQSCQENIVLILRIPRRVEIHNTNVGTLKVKEAHVEVFYHFGLRAAGLFLFIPARIKLFLSQCLHFELVTLSFLILLAVFV